MSNYFGEWEVKIIYTVVRMGYYVYLTRIKGDTRLFLSKNGTVIETIVSEVDNKLTEDDLAFAFLDPDQLHALAEGIADSGVKTVNDAKNEGLLEATNKHLEDMRSLVFKIPINNLNKN